MVDMAKKGLELLDKYGIKYNIVKIYPNGVRIGNVPNHKERSKQKGTGQSWFPKSWTEKRYSPCWRTRCWIKI